MKNTQLKFEEALGSAMPRILHDKKSVSLLVEILQEHLFSADTDHYIAEELTGKGSFGEFSIHIYEFLGIYWIAAPDFDDEGYFTSLNDALSFAKKRYEPFITDYLEGKE